MHSKVFALIERKMNIETNDARMRKAMETSNELGIKVDFIENPAAVDHPNTVRLIIGNEVEQMELMGISIGGGKVEITERSEERRVGKECRSRRARYQ